MVDSNFSSVEGCALSSLLNLVTKINFSLRFQYKQFQIFLPIATSVAENDEKSVKQRLKFGKISVYKNMRELSSLTFLLCIICTQK